MRALIDGVEARLGSGAFCGAADLAGAAHACDPEASLIAFARGAERTVLLVRQALRPDAVATVRALRELGLELRILSGDRAAAVAPNAEALGIATWEGGCRPADKIAAIEALKAQGRRVLMVGDGLNDAPALASAHVSLSPITAADVAQAHSDAVFLGDRLAPALDAVRIARKARGLMHQNLWLAVIYNAVAVPVAISGLVTPLIAALAMSGSSVLVTLNALRARAPRDPLAEPARAGREMLATAGAGT